MTDEPFDYTAWENEECIVTFRGSPVGQTVSKYEAIRIAAWANSALKEIMERM